MIGGDVSGDYYPSYQSQMPVLMHYAQVWRAG